ncbi:MAG: hypothetical protein QOH29_1750 [Actinomycetota bacterium]|jgi:hypothetical protein|nr:hypothetical protein [Actinomycetota bacterium]
MSRTSITKSHQKLRELGGADAQPTGMRLAKRSAAVAALLGALVIAAPIADAGAATTPGACPGFSFDEVPLSFVAPSVGSVAFARGPTVINDVFNGATVVQSVNGAACSSVIGS